MAAAEPVDADLPKALVKRIVKAKLSSVDVANGGDGTRDFQVNKDALLAFCESGKVFIHYLTATANDVCKEAKRQTISADDVITALEDLEFGELVPQLKEALEAYKAEAKEKNKKKAEQTKKRKLDKEQDSAAAGAEGGAGAADDGADGAEQQPQQGEGEQPQQPEQPPAEAAAAAEEGEPQTAEQELRQEEEALEAPLPESMLIEEPAAA